MNVLIIVVHPEQRSLTTRLAYASKEHLESLGHSVRVSDLYAEKFKAILDRDDFVSYDAERRLSLHVAARERHENSDVPADILAEQEKILWADAVIFQFPIWWYGIPAMLKGWIDRVWTYGFGYGMGEYTAERWGDRYGEGRLAGKRAMLSLTTGGWEGHYSDRGVNGPLEELLFAVNHGNLYYAGFAVLPHFVIYQADTLTQEQYEEKLSELQGRLDNLFVDEPIPYRMQNGGDYEVPSLRLKEGRERGDEKSYFDLHKKF